MSTAPTAVLTAVGAVVSTVLLAVAFALVLSFRWLVVPRGPSATHQELFLDFTRPAPTAVATFMPPKSVEAIERLTRASPEKPVSTATFARTASSLRTRRTTCASS